jgi:hypothetical protein
VRMGKKKRMGFGKAMEVANSFWMDEKMDR